MPAQDSCSYSFAADRRGRACTAAAERCGARRRCGERTLTRPALARALRSQLTAAAHPGGAGHPARVAGRDDITQLRRRRPRRRSMQVGGANLLAVPLFGPTACANGGQGCSGRGGRATGWRP